MGIRAKLLVILLVLAVVPLLVGAAASRSTLRALGDRLTDEAEQRVLTDERRQLGVIATSLAETVRARATEIERLLRVQATAAIAAIEGAELIDAVWFDANSDFGSYSTVPGLIDRNIVGFDTRGTRSQRVSTLHQSFLLQQPEDPDQRAVAGRLSSMDIIYRAMSADRPALLYGQYVTTADGVHAKFPGHGGYPDGFDPRNRSWYQLAAESFYEDGDHEDPMWGPPIFDATTGQLIITASMPLIGSDGDLLGVAAVDVRISDVLSGVPEALPWAKDARALITVIVGSERTSLHRLLVSDNREAPPVGTVLILAERDQAEAGLSWSIRPESEVFLLDDPDDHSRFVSDIQGARRAMIDSSIDGQPYLCAYTPFRFDGHGASTALVLLVPRSAVDRIPAEIRASFDRQITTQLATNGGLVFTSVLLVISAALLLSKRLTRPVNELAEAARRVAAGQLDVRVTTTGKDELGALAASFSDMLPKLRERLELRHSLNLAKDVQQQLLPKVVPSLPGLDIAGRSVYCDETGGDYYDFFDLTAHGSTGIAIAVGDVTGHGVAAALLMTTARAMLRTLIGRERDLSQLMTSFNNNLSDDTGDGRFMTLNLSMLTPLDDGCFDLRWVSAGHDSPICIGPRGTVEFEGGGIPLGIQREWAYEEHHTIIEPGQIMLIGTDGIWEARNSEGHMFGKQRLVDVLNGIMDQPADSIADAVIRAVERFRGNSPQTDDITLIVVRAFHLA